MCIMNFDELNRPVEILFRASDFNSIFYDKVNIDFVKHMLNPILFGYDISKYYISDKMISEDSKDVCYISIICDDYSKSDIKKFVKDISTRYKIDKVLFKVDDKIYTYK